MYGQDILCGISKVPFEIPHKISYPYIERYDFYTTLKFSELLELRAHMRFWNAPLQQQMRKSQNGSIYPTNFLNGIYFDIYHLTYVAMTIENIHNWIYHVDLAY